MTERQKAVERLCSEALERLSSWPGRDETEDFKIKVSHELEAMRDVLDPEAFTPSYPHAVLDSGWFGELGDFLLRVSYEYGRIRKGSRLRLGTPPDGRA